MFKTLTETYHVIMWYHLNNVCSHILKRYTISHSKYLIKSWDPLNATKTHPFQTFNVVRRHLIFSIKIQFTLDVSILMLMA